MKSILNSSKRPSVQADEIDIDVTPIMNMFIILIPFLVSMAVFAHLAILPFTLPPAAGAGKGPKTDDLKITIAMSKSGHAITLGEKILETLPRIKDTYDYAELTNTLTKYRTSLKHKDEVVIAVDDGIKFDHVVHTMDYCRDALFTKIGLASGAHAAYHAKR